MYFSTINLKKLRYFPSGQERDEASKIKKVRNGMTSVEIGSNQGI